MPDAGPPLAEVREPRVWRLALRAPILLLVALVGVPVLLLALLPGVRGLPVAGQPLALRVQTDLLEPLHLPDVQGGLFWPWAFARSLWAGEPRARTWW